MRLPKTHSVTSANAKLAKGNTVKAADTGSVQSTASVNVTAAVTSPSSTDAIAVTINSDRRTPMRLGKKGDDDLHYERLLPWEKDAEEKIVNSTSLEIEQENTGIFIVEEEFSGRNFSDGETSIYSFIEFLQLCVGRKASCADNLFALTEDEFNGKKRVSFGLYKRNMMQRILFNNPRLNQDFMAYIHGDISIKPWQKWVDVFLSVNQTDQTDHIRKQLEKLPADIAREFNATDDQNKRKSFELFYSMVEKLRSTSFDNRTGIDSCSAKGEPIRWSSRMLFPYCQEALYPECEVNQKYDPYFMQGQGHILFWMLALALHGDIERQKRISNLLCQNFLDAENEQARFIKLLAQIDPQSEPQEVTLQFFPVYESELFEHYAEDFEHVLGLNLVQEEMFDILQRLSSFYLILFLLERSSLMDARCKLEAEPDKRSSLKELQKHCDFPYFLLAFESKAYLDPFKHHCDDIIARVRRSLDNFVKFKIERELSDQQYFDMVSCQDGSNVDLDLLIKIVQAVFKVRLPKNKSIEEDFEFNKLEKITYTDFLNCVYKRFSKRRNKTRRTIDSVIEELTRNIGLATRSSNRVHFAVTDGFLKMLVLVTCKKDSPMRNKDFLDTIFERYHLVIGELEQKQLLRLKHKCSALADKDFLILNASALKERLNNQRLCGELSDNNFYYIFNPYKTKGHSKAATAKATEKRN